jgi:cytochrome c peroxidase
VVLTKGFNVPSLKSVARTAPFMHDGSMKTLEERVFNNPSDSHGSTSSLSEDEKTALVAFLKTL